MKSRETTCLPTIVFVNEIFSKTSHFDKINQLIFFNDTFYICHSFDEYKIFSQLFGFFAN